MLIGILYYFIAKNFCGIKYQRISQIVQIVNHQK
jgi:hypothetical protein